MEPRLAPPLRFGTSAIREVNDRSVYTKAMSQTTEERIYAKSEAKREGVKKLATTEEAQSLAKNVAMEVKLDELQDKLLTKGRPRSTTRKNVNDNPLFVGDYVEFSPAKDSLGQPRPENAPKLSGRILEQAFEQEDFVKIVELKDGSLTDLKSDYVYTVDKPRVTKIIPQPTA